MSNNMEKKAFLFKNEKYEQGGNHPIYKGNFVLDGKKLNISFWLKQADGKGKLPQGTMFLSGEIDDWEPQKQNTPAQSAPTFSDDIPF